MSSRRDVLGLVASIALSGCAGFAGDGGGDGGGSGSGGGDGNGGGGSDAAPGGTTTSVAGISLDATHPTNVPTGSSVALLPAATSTLRSAAGDTPSAAGDAQWWECLAEFECFTFEGTTYAVSEATSGDDDAFGEQSFELREATDGDCVAVSELDLKERHYEAFEAPANGDMPVPEETAEALRTTDFDFVVVGILCYETPPTISV